MTSAAFSIDSTTCPAAVSTTYGATVTLQVLDMSNLNNATFSVAADGTGMSQNLTVAPTITHGTRGSATFTFPSDPGDNRGASVGIMCRGVDANGTQHLAYGLVGVVNPRTGLLPPAANERLWRHATDGWLEVIDEAASLAFGGVRLGTWQGTKTAVPVTGSPPEYTQLLGFAITDEILPDMGMKQFSMEIAHGDDGGDIENSHIETVVFSIIREGATASSASYTIKVGASASTHGTVTALNGTIDSGLDYQLYLSGGNFSILIERSDSGGDNQPRNARVDLTHGPAMEDLTT